METLKIKEILEATGGKLICGDAQVNINSICTDSRKIEQGCLFVPLVGETFDGHNFIEQALSQGAAACITGKDIDISTDKAIIKVDDTLSAFQAIAKYYRGKFDIPFVAITGSVGKTTTKEMIACVLEQKYNVLKTAGNFNNEIGLPITVLKLDRTHQIGVVEMGMSGVGEIDRLTNIINPDTAVITNIGVSHIEKLGSQENILKAKLEILNGMHGKGNLVLNADDLLLANLEKLPVNKMFYYGINSNIGLYPYNIENLGEEGSRYFIKIENVEYCVEVPVAGEHNIYNSLAAICVGIIYNVPITDILAGIKNFAPGKMRQNILHIKNDITVIEDCYNASPQSMEAAISVMASLEGLRKIAVLADMLEMGEYSANAHEKVGEFAAQNEVDYLFLYGNFKEYIKKGAVDKGIDERKILLFDKKEDMIYNLKEFMKPNDIILVKGSRGMKMEQVVSCLCEVG